MKNDTKLNFATAKLRWTRNILCEMGLCVGSDAYIVYGQLWTIPQTYKGKDHTYYCRSKRTQSLKCIVIEKYCMQ